MTTKVGVTSAGIKKFGGENDDIKALQE